MTRDLVPFPGSMTVAPRVPRLPPHTRLRREIAGPARVGLLAALLFFGLGGGWAATARLASAVIANGVVSPESVRHTIQHLEGGIIREIAVKEGQTVAPGDVLVVLDDIAASADVGTLRSQLTVLAAQEARLTAEHAGASEVVFSHPVFAREPMPEAIAARDQEISRFDTRRASLATEKTIVQQRIQQINAQIAGYEAQIVGVREQMEFLRQEIGIAQTLFDKGLDRLPRLLALKRALAERSVQEGALEANIARSREAIAEMQIQSLNLDIRRRDEVDGSLAETRGRRVEVEEQIRKIEDRLSRTTIRSPVAGTVLAVRFRTESGVVRPGEPIMEIVPSGEELLISARVAPTNIDEIRPGLSAYVAFPAYSQRTMLRMQGLVRTVAADTMQDERTGQRYYTVTVEVPREEIEASAPQIELVAGMPAEVYIATGENTPLEYLIKPLRMAVERAMREG